jgi:hypothetical protein
MLPIASDIAIRNTADVATSALPAAPVRRMPPQRQSATRIGLATFLRASAQRRARLADRIDPCTHAEPVTT